MRSDRLTLDGLRALRLRAHPRARKSKHFKNVSFSSPTTKAGDKERFTLVAEVEK